MTVVESDVSCAIGTRIEASKRYPMRRNEVVAAFGTMLVIAGVMPLWLPSRRLKQEASFIPLLTTLTEDFPSPDLPLTRKEIFTALAILQEMEMKGLLWRGFSVTPNKNRLEVQSNLHVHGWRY